MEGNKLTEKIHRAEIVLRVRAFASHACLICLMYWISSGKEKGIKNKKKEDL